jgi:hypothetical protein
MNADRSASSYIRRLKARTLAVYHQNNPAVNDFGGSAKPSSGETLLLRTIGTSFGPGATCETCVPCEDVCDFEIAFVFPFALSEITELESQIESAIGQPFTIAAPPSGYGNAYGLILFFPPVCNATEYEVQVNHNDEFISAQVTPSPFYNTEFFFSQTAFYIIYPSEDISEGSFYTTVSAVNPCSSSSTIAEFGCFLEGAPVTMSDGSTKPIQDVKVGDVVQGAFGEVNEVLALHRPLLGAGKMVRINDEHSTTAHHPHISTDRQFHCVDPMCLKSMTYGKKHTVILGNGKKELRTMTGVAPERIKDLTVGTLLQTVSGGRAVTTLADVPLSPFTQVYHLVVGGSHTYMVEGYAVVGWAREDDFDYDAWTTRA